MGGDGEIADEQRGQRRGLRLLEKGISFYFFPSSETNGKAGVSLL
jgi:hypothetical protein